MGFIARGGRRGAGGGLRSARGQFERQEVVEERVV
jgi:hypothetical protein